LSFAPLFAICEESHSQFIKNRQSQMFIQTEDTPNPQSMKFLPGQEVLGTGRLGLDFPSKEAAAQSPLAQELFALDGVEGVFLGADFVTVTKNQSLEWQHLKPSVLGALADFLSAGGPVLADSAEAAQSGGSADEYEGETKEIVTMIIDLLETRVRPAVAQDGGDIKFERYAKEEGIVYLSMRGACAGCPSSTMTLKQGVENLIKHYVPEVTAVEAIAQ
jgi:NFU1 iron-sulfur cluster scaffold homolog, mitochondrial